MEQHHKDRLGCYLDLGLQFAIAVGLGVGLGYVLDSKFNTLPLFLILGLLLGGSAGFLNLYRAVYPKRSNKDEKYGDQEN